MRPGFGRSASPARDSRSTTSRRDIGFSLTASRSPRGRSPRVSSSHSSKTAGMTGRRCGSPTAGRLGSSTAGRPRCTGSSTAGRLVDLLRSAGRGRSTRPSRFATSVTTRPMRSPGGPGCGCRPRPNGKSRSKATRWRETSSTPVASTRPRTRAAASSSGTCGSGRRARTLPTLATDRRRRAGRVQRQIHVQPDGPARRVVRHPGRACSPDLPKLLSAQTPAGSSPASDLRRMYPMTHRHTADPDRHFPGRRTRRPRPAAEGGSVQVFLRRRRLAAVRPHHRTRRVLLDPDRTRHHAAARRPDGRAVRPGVPAGRTRGRQSDQGPVAARPACTGRPGTSRSMCPAATFTRPPPRWSEEHPALAVLPHLRRLHPRNSRSRTWRRPGAWSTSPARRSGTSTPRRPMHLLRWIARLVRPRRRAVARRRPAKRPARHRGRLQ